MPHPRWLPALLFALALSLPQAAAGVPAAGGNAAATTQPQNEPPAESPNWLARVARTQARQPHWITPLVTVTPRLEQEFRFDFIRQSAAPGSTTISYGGGKGLELIPFDRVEVILGVPPSLAHTKPGARDGIGDTNFLVKYRVRAANERQGNYILSLFFGVSAPTGTNGNSAGHTIFTPSIAFGKGWGRFDVQSTLAVAVPSGAVDRLGTPLPWNTAIQYRVWTKFWPELEINSTIWPNGQRAGEKEAFLTPGLVVGKLPIHHRLGLTLGAGTQIALTSFHRYNHSWIVSLRLPF